MYKKPETEAYLQRVVEASMKVPTDTTVTLLHNMVEDTDFSNAFGVVDDFVQSVPKVATTRKEGARSEETGLGSRVRKEWGTEAPFATPVTHHAAPTRANAKSPMCGRQEAPNAQKFCCLLNSTLILAALVSIDDQPRTWALVNPCCRSHRVLPSNTLSQYEVIKKR
jgi:hypothetical protein